MRPVAPRELDVGLWRYLDLPKFISLLDKRALHFVRASDLGDPFEGALSQGTLAARPGFVTATASQLRANGLDWSEADVEAMLSASGGIIRSEAMINCWHMNDHESAAMWGLYCPSGGGVAIRSTAARLSEVLPKQIEDSAILVWAVRYVDYDIAAIPEMSLLERLAHKRLSYAHEQELRAGLIHRDSPPFVAVPVDLSKLVEAVYVAPGMPSWHRGIVESLVDRYGLNVEVRQSRLDDPAVK